MDPAGAEDLLAPGPESLPRALIHAMDEKKGAAFEPAQYGELFARWDNSRGRWSAKIGPKSGSCLDWIGQLATAALPPHHAESLRLSA